MAGTAPAFAAAIGGHPPDAPALVWRDTATGYGELWAAALRERDRVRALPLPAGAPIGLLVDKSPAGVALVLGALLSGRPALLPPASLPEAVLHELFASSGCACTMSPDAVAGVPGAGPPQVPAGTALMLTTSGSTGLPKVVPLPSAGIGAFTRWAGDRFGIGAGTAVLSYAPLSFDLSLLDVWTTLARGGTAVLVDPDDALHAGRLAAAIRRWRVEVVQAVPMVFGLLAGTGGAFDSVRHAIATGDALSPDGVAALPATFPSARLHNLYGCTETNDSLLHEIDPVRDAGGPVPIGTPLPGVAVRLIGDDGAEVTGAGSGELWVRTPFQSTGYLGAAAGTGRFTHCPGDPGGPVWYRSGDLVERRPDGALVLLGRTDFRVKVRGVGVDLGAVEAALSGHAEVLEAVVFAVPERVGGRRLRGLARRTPGSALTTLGLRRHCAAVLPRGAIPSDLLIVDTALPRNANGKLDRAAVAREHPPTQEGV
ncbi:AMP-binding protein [Actinokineospora sp. PR83]|uniref:AMP-binding protein n=1 Tax=Actinokineospora sp. PR83 TaxID=2884908 RepID=UPI001F17F4C1|nr:AMP-binding protein [Actinokineospora sp. PR83]MCG8920576.1 AMP-binding protein [Actinokineospora sp. PR83]